VQCTLEVLDLRSTVHVWTEIVVIAAKGPGSTVASILVIIIKGEPNLLLWAG
jgi:hypothetical protein